MFCDEKTHPSALLGTKYRNNIFLYILYKGYEAPLEKIIGYMTFMSNRFYNLLSFTKFIVIKILAKHNIS